MKKLILILTIGMLNLSFSFGQGINFETQLSWAQIKEKAKKENKYIFLDLFTTWCTPCKVMDTEVFNKSEVGAFFNDKFISVKVQGDKTSTDSEYIMSWYADAQMLTNHFTQVIPTYIIMAPDSEPIYKFSGSKTAEEFLMHIKTALAPDNRHLTTLLQKIISDNFDAGSIRMLSARAKDLGLHNEISRQLQQKIKKITPVMLLKPENAWLVWEFTGSIKERGFDLMWKYGSEMAEADPLLAQVYLRSKLKDLIHREIVEPAFQGRNIKDLAGKDIQIKVMTEDSLSVIAKRLKYYGELGSEIFLKQKTYLAAKQMREARVFEDKIKPFLVSDSSWSVVKQKIEEQKPDIGEEWLIGNAVVYYLNRLEVDSNRFLPLVINAQQYYNDRFPHMLNGLVLNERAWVIFTSTNNMDLLRIAQSWARKAFELHPYSTGILDTYANLTYKTGDKQKGIELYRSVLDMAPDADFTIYAKKVLKLMEEGKPIYKGDQFLGW